VRLAVTGVHELFRESARPFGRSRDGSPRKPLGARR
jgi:hypothetical protein